MIYIMGLMYNIFLKKFCINNKNKIHHTNGVILIYLNLIKWYLCNYMYISEGVREFRMEFNFFKDLNI